MNTTVKISPAQVFPVANKIRAAKHISMKEAYAEAKAQLIAEAENAVKTAETAVETPINVVETPTNMNLHTELVEKMKNGNVKFVFFNNKGKKITTTGTLDMSKVPTNRDVQGRKTAKDENTQVFYDVRHGVYRSYQKDKLVEIISKKK